MDLFMGVPLSHMSASFSSSRRVSAILLRTTKISRDDEPHNTGITVFENEVSIGARRFWSREGVTLLASVSGSVIPGHLPIDQIFFGEIRIF